MLFLSLYNTKNKNMKLNSFIDNTLENIKNIMDSNGYCWFSKENYDKKNNLPCFIPENHEDLSDVKSWKDLYSETLERVKTKDFLLTVCENYDCESVMTSLGKVDESAIDFKDIYLEVTGETPEKFAEGFMDSYFLGGDEMWCSLSTKLDDYTY